MDTNSITFKNKVYTLDKNGFLNPPDQWDKIFADGMAHKVGIEGGLSEKHWDFISYLRNKFVNERIVPVVVIACMENQLRLNEFRKLFPTGYHRGACKIAGMKKPRAWSTG